MKQNTQKKAGIILQYSQMGLAILISFIYTPIMLKILGKSEYGIYNLASSIISYLSLLSLGFAASYIRFYSLYNTEKNKEQKINNLNGMFLLVFILIGVVAFVGGIILSENVSIFFNDTYSIRDKEIARILMLFMTFNLSLSFPMSVFTSYITAQEKFVFQKVLSMIRTVIGPFLTLPALLIGWGSIGMVVVTTVVGLVVDVANIFFCLTKLKMRFDISKLDFKLLKEIAGFSVFIAINQIIDQVNWSTDKIILGKICDSSAVAIYAIGAQINTYFISFSTAISSVFTPQIHRIENSIDDLNIRNKVHTDLMIRVGRIQFMILALILTGFIFWGKFFISVWAGRGYDKSYYVALLLISPAIISLIQNIGIEIQRAKNKHQFRSIAYLIMAIINVLISIWFTSLWGEIGAALGTTISLVLANGIIMNIFYHRVLHIDMIRFWRNILSFVPSLIIPIIIGTIMSKVCIIKTFCDFIIQIIFYIAIYMLSIYLIGMNKSEKDIIKRPVKKIINTINIDKRS